MKPSKPNTPGKDGRTAIHILFADNDETFIRAVARNLTQQGWEVTTATKLEMARHVLESGWFHVAILDLRLNDDEDDHDISGLLLAKEPRFSPIPKIIYTTHVNGAQREAQALAEPLLLVSKQDDRSMLVEAVHTTLNRTPTNWSSQVTANPATGLSLRHLSEAISHTRSNNAEMEVTDLFRRLFHNEQRRVIIERVLWSSGHRIALEISAQAPVAGKEFFIVVAGPRETTEDEVRLYRSVGPKAQGGNSTYLSNWVITMHFGAVAYAIYTTETDGIRHLRAAYRKPKEFQAAVKGLFETTLPPWHRDDSCLGTEAVGGIYRRSLLGELSTAKLASILGELTRQSGRVRSEVRYENGRLYLSGGPSGGYSDPMSRVSKWPGGNEPAWMANSPGRLTGENVLVDANGRAWCTDFARAGAAPVLANHVALEAMIRFDWVECSALGELHEMEQRLTDPKDFRQLDSTAIDAGCRTALQAIREVRSLASTMTNFDVNSYHAGIYYEAIGRLASFDWAEPPTPKQLARLLHALVAAAMIVTPDSATVLNSGLEIDRVNREVRINGRLVPLARLQFDILKCLHAKKPHLCTYEDIFTTAFNEPYDGDRQQMNKLHRAMNELRNAIEGKIENIPRSGFRLNT